MKNNKNRFLAIVVLVSVFGNLTGAQEGSERVSVAYSAPSWLQVRYRWVKNWWTGALDEFEDVQDYWNKYVGRYESSGIRDNLAMEDFTLVNPEETGWYGVFDGHGGSWAAEVAKRSFVLEFERAGGDLQQAFVALENRIRQIYERKKAEQKDLDYEGAVIDYFAGTTAAVARVSEDGKLITVGHVGDSRVLLIRGKEVVATTSDHRPALELAHLMLAGAVDCGVVSKDRNHLDGLRLSRSLGDFESKKHLAALGAPKALIAKPDIQEWHSQPGDVLLLCSDGVHDVIGNTANKRGKGIVELVAENRGARTAQEIAAIVGQEALKRDTHDNVSVVVKLLR